MLGAAALIYAFMLPQKKVDKSSSELMIKEVEATLEQYMVDIEQENDVLVEIVGQMKKDTITKQMVFEEQVSEMQQRLQRVEQQSMDYEVHIAAIKQDKALHATALVEIQSVAVDVTDTTALEQSEVAPEPANSIKQRYSELFELYEQGKSIDMIGKLIGLQRGEVQLILQLAKQEGSI
jgi:hypothetical protein